MSEMDKCSSTTTFEAYIHNPWCQPIIPHKAAMVAAQRKQRFIGEYNAVEDGKERIRELFDNNIILNTGMRKAYANFLSHTRADPYGIGVVLSVAYERQNGDSFANYQTIDGSQTPLYEVSIARRLLTEYMTNTEIMDLIKNMPCAKQIEKQIRDSLKLRKK